MNRRPWPILLLAILYGISPFLYPVFAALYFGTSLVDVVTQTLESNTPLRNFDAFVLPGILGLATFFARPSSYVIVVVGSVYLAIRSVYAFLQTGPSDTAATLLFANVFFISVVVYLLRRDTRSIYFDKKMRWWETDPRYVLPLEGTIARIGTTPVPVRLKNIAIGGAAIETSETGFASHEAVQIEFRDENEHYRLPAVVVWDSEPSVNGHLIGVQWSGEKSSPDRMKVKDLIRSLKSKGVPTTRIDSSRWADFKAWLSR